MRRLGLIPIMLALLLPTVVLADPGNGKGAGQDSGNGGTQSQSNNGGGEPGRERFGEMHVWPFPWVVPLGP